jgi:cytochrome c-type biogenesis protein CcmH/NrfG
VIDPIVPTESAPPSPARRTRLVVGIGIVSIAVVALVVARPSGAPRPAGADAASSAEAASTAADPMAAGLEALYKKHDPVAAAAQFREVLARNPQHYGATYQLATALDQANKPAESRPVWARMLPMAEAIRDAATATRARARLADIDRLASPGADPDAETMRLGIEALHTKQDPVAAAALFRQVLAHNPDHYGATFQLATALDQANRPAESRPIWTRVLGLAEAINDAPVAATARARLAKSP